MALHHRCDLKNPERVDANCAAAHRDRREERIVQVSSESTYAGLRSCHANQRAPAKVDGATA